MDGNIILIKQENKFESNDTANCVIKKANLNQKSPQTLQSGTKTDDLMSLFQLIGMIN